MERRVLGSTGEKLSVVGFGGMVVRDTEQSEANEIVAKAFNERGINYYDVAPTYGNAEERLGPALEPYRAQSFLACKTGERSAEGAAEELEASLRKLRTDHFDLYQLHAVTTMEDVEQIMAPGGALETFIKARQQGKVRYLGFSAHSEEAALALMDQFDFDSILFPFSWVTWHQGNFGPRVLEKAVEREMGVLALKALAKRAWREDEERDWPKCWYKPVESREEADLALRFALSKPITAAVCPSHAEFLWWACDVADKFTLLSAEEEELVKKRSQGLTPIFSSDD